MLAAETELAACYARCHEALHLDGLAATVDRFVDEAWAIRNAVPWPDWKHAVEVSRRSVAHRQLLADPYTRDAFAKPRGYPGDADTLDYVYGYRGPDEADEMGKSLFAISTSVPLAQAVRSRCAQIASHVSNTGPDAVVVSVAAGHMRELHQVQDPAGRSFLAIDHDARTLDRVAAVHCSCRLVSMKPSVLEFVSGRFDCPPADLIYSAGLFDYLKTASALSVLRSLVRSLKPDGLLVVANLTGVSPEIAYMEAVMDWWMQYRGPGELKTLVDKAGISPALANTYTTDDGRVAWLTVRAAA
jgi:extracellular factor (EF) 3-hydroxypalmitic acid methyl ester biosynthesis protein